MGCTSGKISDYVNYKNTGDRSSFDYGKGHVGEGSQRTFAAQIMQQCEDNGLDIGGDFAKWKDIISSESFTFDGTQVFADDGWTGKNRGDKSGQYMGQQEFQALCMVMADLEDMRNSGKMTMDEYEAKMTELFQPETIQALMIGDNGSSEEREPFLALARDVANMHGDDPAHADARKEDTAVARTNAGAMPVGKRPVINASTDYAYMRFNEEFEKNPDQYMWSNVGQNFEGDFNDMDNIVSQWAAAGLLPEGMTVQQASAMITSGKSVLEENYMTQAASVTALAYAFKDVDAIADPAVKKDYIASLFSDGVINDVLFSESGKDMGPGVQFLADLDMARRNPEFVAEAYADIDHYDTGGGTQPGDGNGGTSSPSQNGDNRVDVPVSEIGDMSVLVRQKPSNRMEILKAEAIEYYAKGSQRDVAETFADRDFTPEEIQQIQMLAAFGPKYLENASAEDIFAITNPGEDLAAADLAHNQARFEAAAKIMTWEDPHAFIAECGKAGIDDGMAAILYDTAATHFRQVSGDDNNLAYDQFVERMGGTSDEKTNILLDASENAIEYVAERTRGEGDGKTVSDAAKEEKEEMREDETSLLLLG